MTNWDRVDQIEPQDGIGKDYDELVKMATESYWVVPINTDNLSFSRHWQATDVATSGKVHYSRRAK